MPLALVYANDFKLILFIDGNIIRSHEISKVTIKRENGEHYELSYRIAELILNEQIKSIAASTELREENLILEFDYCCLAGTNRRNFHIELKAYYFDAEYLILRLYTDNKKNKRKFYFNKDEEYIWEYDSPYASARRPLNTSFFQRLFRF